MLAAANSVYGRWDDTKGEENIDFMPTILSRFDMIFIVKDEHDESRDTVSWAMIIITVLTRNKVWGDGLCKLRASDQILIIFSVYILYIIVSGNEYFLNQRKIRMICASDKKRLHREDLGGNFPYILIKTYIVIHHKNCLGDMDIIRVKKRFVEN